MKINSLLTQETHSYLFNLELTPATLRKFQGVRYVLMQGSSKRALSLAQKLAQEVLGINSAYFTPVNLVNTSNYAVYRVGNILSVSHGMGNVSIDALLHALTKLLYFSGNQNVEYIRIGTSGGLGLAAGSVVITRQAFMPNLAAYYSTYELDREVKVPTHFNQDLVERIQNAQPQQLPFSLVVGNSIAADDFYLGQCRYDGAMPARCDETQRAQFFKQAQQLNILNFEMESTALAAFCHLAAIPATMIAVTLINRLETDQVAASSAELEEYAKRAQQVALNYILTQADIC